MDHAHSNAGQIADVSSLCKQRRAFTRLERTLIAIGILSVAIAIAAYFIDYAKTHWARIASQSNMRQIGLGLQMYANANGDRLPFDWANLILAKDIELTPDVFVSPFSVEDDGRRSLSKDVRARLIITPGSFNCTYLYTAANLSFQQLPADAVLAIEPAEVNGSEGAQLLFRDGRVEWIPLVGRASRRAEYDQLLTDFANGIRPLEFHP